MLDWLQKIILLAKYGRIPEVGDREFRKQFLEHAYKNVPSEDFSKLLTKRVLKIISSQTSEKRRQTEMASRTFFESCEKLYVVYAEVCQTEWQMYHINELHRLRGSDSSGEVQKTFIRNSESLSQRIYATLSSYVKLLSHIADGEFLQTMPSGNMNNFLDFLEKKLPNSGHQIEIVRKTSHEFRGKYVDHPNHITAYNWYTCDVFGKVRIIYYSQKGELKQIDITEQLESPMKFLTTFPASSVFVPPYHTDAMESLVSIMRSLAQQLESI